MNRDIEGELRQAFRAALQGTRKQKHPALERFLLTAASGCVPAVFRIRDYVSPVHEYYEFSWHRDERPPGARVRENRAAKAAVELAHYASQMDDFEFDDWAGDLHPFGHALAEVLQDPKYAVGVEASKTWRALLISFGESIAEASNERVGPPENTYAFWLAETINALEFAWKETFDEAPAASPTSPFYFVVRALFDVAGKHAPAANTVRKALKHSS